MLTLRPSWPQTPWVCDVLTACWRHRGRLAACSVGDGNARAVINAALVLLLIQRHLLTTSISREWWRRCEYSSSREKKKAGLDSGRLDEEQQCLLWDVVDYCCLGSEGRSRERVGNWCTQLVVFMANRRSFRLLVPHNVTTLVNVLTLKWRVIDDTQGRRFSAPLWFKYSSAE